MHTPVYDNTKYVDGRIVEFPNFANASKSRWHAFSSVATFLVESETW
jgi:hypothetical protein